MFDFNVFKKNVNDLAEQIRKIRSEIETNKQRRDLLTMAPPTKADMTAILHARIDALAEGYPERLASHLQPWMAINASDLRANPLGFLFANRQNYGGQLGNASSLVEGLSYLLGDQLKQSVARAIEAAPWPDGAVSLADRDKEIKKLGEKIVQLETEEASLQKQAADAGIIINF